MIDPHLKSVARRLLPGFVLARLDPVQEIIESEVKGVAAGVNAGHVVLDAGAGEAPHRKYFTRGRYIALDSGTGDPSWDYSRLDVCGDLESLPLRDASVDRIICMVVLEHTRYPRRVMEEFVRVLKPGGTLHMVVPFLWEEHQAPHDYLRFTRSGIRLLLEEMPLQLELLEPMGGFFWVCSRRCVNLLGFFQKGWRRLLFLPLAAVFGLLFPMLLYYMDRLDRNRDFTLGFRIRATREGS